MPALNTYQSVDGFIGLGVEAVQGTPVPSTSYLDLLSESLEYDPAPIIEKLLRGQRDVAYNAVPGEQKIAGKFSTPFYPDHGLEAFTAGIGTDVYQTGGASTGGVAIPAMAAGLLTVSLVAQTGTPIAVGDYIEFRQASGAAGVANLSEIHKVTGVSGAGPYAITWTDHATYNAYTTAGLAYRIASTVSTFTHILQPDQPNANAYKTLTLEKNLGGLTSQQFAGCAIDKMALKTDTKGTASVDYDVMGTAYAAIAPTTATYVSSTPLALANYTSTLFGAPDTSLTAFSVDVAQGVKEYWTYNGGNLPGVVAPAERVVTGKWTNILQSITYFNNAKAGTQGALTFLMTQGAMSVSISLPQIVIQKASMPIKIGELVMFDATFQALFNSTAGYSIQATVVTTKYAPLA
jgi:hypothetical protein